MTVRVRRSQGRFLARARRKDMRRRTVLLAWARWPLPMSSYTICASAAPSNRLTSLPPQLPPPPGPDEPALSPSAPSSPNSHRKWILPDVTNVSHRLQIRFLPQFLRPPDSISCRPQIHPLSLTSSIYSFYFSPSSMQRAMYREKHREYVAAAATLQALGYPRRHSVRVVLRCAKCHKFYKIRKAERRDMQIEVDVYYSDESFARLSVPSDASTGGYEALD